MLIMGGAQTLSGGLIRITYYLVKGGTSGIKFAGLT
jgi:hypothetical protein